MPLHLHVLRQLWIQLIDFRTLHESFFECAVGLLVMSFKRNPPELQFTKMHFDMHPVAYYTDQTAPRDAI